MIIQYSGAAMLLGYLTVALSNVAVSSPAVDLLFASLAIKFAYMTAKAITGIGEAIREWRAA